MINLEYYENALDKEPSKQLIVQEGDILGDAIRALTGHDNPIHPIICLIGKDDCILQKEWDSHKISKDINYKIVRQMGDPGTIILAIVAVFSAYTYLTMPKPNLNAVSSLPEPEPSFWKKGQSNQNKLGQSMEGSYGRCRIYPSYSASTFNVSVSNNDVQYQQFNIGYGYYDVEEPQFEDTFFSNFEGVEYQFTEPNVTPNLFSNNVVTSSEISNIELFATNDNNYVGFLGPYTVNEAGTLCNRIELDFFLNGLYKNVENVLYANSVRYVAEYREINDNGTPIGSWQTLVNKSKTASTVDTIRFSESKAVPAGRYEIRIRRGNTSTLKFSDADKLIFAGLKGYLKSESDYSRNTHLSVKAVATNNLNDSVSNRINLFATRKLPIWDKSTQSWSEPQPTRSPIWAFIDVAKNKYYGGGLKDEFLDLDYLADIAQEWEAKKIYFDFIFEQKASCWDIYKLILRVGGAVPIQKRGILSIAIDEPQMVASEIFNESNMISASYSIRNKKESDYDGVQIVYTDSKTWNAKTVDCLVGSDKGENLEVIQLAGVVDRNRAYQIGMQIRQGVVSNNQTFKLKTTMLGELVSYGSLVIIDHSILCNKAQSGYIKSIEGDILTLNKDITIEANKSYTVKIRGKKGEQNGAFFFTKIDNNKIQIENFVDVYDIDDFKEIKPIYVIEEQGDSQAYFKVMDLTPSGDREVEITCVNYDDKVYSYSNAQAPSENVEEFQSTPLAPVVTGLTASVITNNPNAMLVSWNPTSGANTYYLESSVNGDFYTQVINSNVTSYILPVSEDYLFLRVSAVGVYQGQYDYWQGAVGANALLGLPSNVWNFDLQQDFEDDFFTIDWEQAPLADEYTLEIYDTNNLSTPLRTETGITSLDYSYTSAFMLADGGETREFTIDIEAQNTAGSSSNKTRLEISNALPAQPSQVLLNVVNQNGNDYEIEATWLGGDEADFKEFKVYASSTQGFTPAISELITTTTSNTATIIATLTSPSTHYVVISSSDVWTAEQVFSAEASITI